MPLNTVWAQWRDFTMVRFSPEFLDELKSRLRPSDVVGRSVRLKKQGSEFAGLSPFTKEKTPSFFVNDQKGFYHCFSSGKHGDIIKFLQETQNLSFHEAVEILAEEAGLALPKDDPKEAERSRQRLGLLEACEAAAVFFRQMLAQSEGREAARYVEQRGLTPAQCETFRIGYAPGAGSTLKQHLLGRGFDEKILLEAGLLIKPDEPSRRGSDSFDRFRNRLMFPITDPRGRVIAFGGRALDPNQRAKYLNSPETPLFHKGSVLYNYQGARTAAGDGQPLLVCEGYMDVIACWGAGFHGAVAPLGTALTEQQLALLWRGVDEPILCFDGDRAGLQAAYRAVDRALELLKPGKSLSFSFLPDGLDPDDFIKDRGVSAFGEWIKDAKPLVDVLWTREKDAKALTTPERRAALRAHLRQLVKDIKDPDVRAAYAQELTSRLREIGPPGASGPAQSSTAPPSQYSAAGGGGRRSSTRGRQNPYRRRGEPTLEDKMSWARQSEQLMRLGEPMAERREATLVLAAIQHPELVKRLESEFFGLKLRFLPIDALLNTVLSQLMANPDLDSEQLKGHIRQTPQADTLERLLKDRTLIIQSLLRPGADVDDVERSWCGAYKRYVADSLERTELPETASGSFTQSGESVWKAAVSTREALRKSQDSQSGGSEHEKTSKDLDDILERMRASVEQKQSRRR